MHNIYVLVRLEIAQHIWIHETWFVCLGLYSMRLGENHRETRLLLLLLIKSVRLGLYKSYFHSMRLGMGIRETRILRRNKGGR